MPFSKIEAVLKQKDEQMSSFFTLADRLATLATAALALTVTFRGNLTQPNPQPAPNLWMLKGS